ncbi:uncharacterized protein [Argopecten irradians]|uniref:uncharacterized protein isoform X2 n=1 Tax=Argopecten irradians TaxID=31199 RepID=UPI003717F11F
MAESMDVTTAKDRRFYSIPDTETHTGSSESTQTNSLIRYISENIIGNEKVFSGPFGLRKVTYLDYTASGRGLKFIEDYIQNEVLPDYGNTHTTTSITSLQTTLYRHEARDVVRNAVHASEHDSVIFCGSGTTAAVHKLIHALNLPKPPIVLVSPYEHHSTLLPWKEAGAKVVRIKEDQNGCVCMADLEAKLKQWQTSGRQIIGCLSAASNITGMLVDVDAITVCLHRHGALAFWDYATAAPYVKIDMNPVDTSEDQPYIYKDAIFMSPHKFVGGVSTPGILVAKKKLFRNVVPDKCGGGSVFYVRRDGHRYLQEPELKEEGGTPAIVESIRAGLVFQLKQAVTSDTILNMEHQLYRRAQEAWRDCDNLVVLGNPDNQNRLAIFSFLIYQPDANRFLHHNFVTAVLNDVFGIQARGGCACAGPYAMDLMGLDEKTAEEIEDLLAEDDRLDRTHLRRYREYSSREIIRPGFVRINLPYFLQEDTFQFIIEAVKLTAQHCWKLLPQYMFNPETGEWRQKNFQVFKDRKWLGHIRYNSGKMQYRVPPPVVKGPLPADYQDCLQKARELFSQAEKTKYQLADHRQMFDDQSQKYRWFLLPSEAAMCLSGQSAATQEDNFVLPFCPPSIRARVGLPPFVAGGHSEEQKEVVCSIGHTVESETVVCPQEHLSDKKTNFGEGMIKALSAGFQSDKESAESNVCKKDLEDFHSVERNMTEEKKDLKVGSDDCKDPELCSAAKRRKKEPSSNVERDDNSSGLVCVTNGAQGSEERSQRLQQESDEGSQRLKQGSDEGSQRLQQGSEEGSQRLQEVSKEGSQEGSQRSKENQKSKNNKTKVQDKKMDKKKSGWFSPPKAIFTPFLKAVTDFDMIQDGDKILVCLSGGKDSLSLLHTIHQYKFYCRSKGLSFEFGAVTVDPQTPSYDPRPLKAYLASLGVPYFYESQCIMETAQNLDYECASICSFCSRMKRGRIYACARREGYNVLALGQHLDDLSESFLMSVFHNGLLRTMKAHYTVDEGDLRVIRPLVYVREKELRTFAEQNKLPVIAENCPACFESPKERHRTKQLLAAQEILHPHLFHSLMSALKPLMAINKTNIQISEMFKQDPSSEDIMDV